MRIAVFGAGGVGGYFGGRLALAGEELVFIARGENLRLLQSQGLQVDSIKGDFVVKPVQATDNPRRVGEVDFVLVAVKGWQVPEAALVMQPMVGPHTGVVPLGNGVEAPAQLAAALGSEPVLGGLCRISAFIAEPGHIRHVGLEPFVAFGELDNRSTTRVEALRQAFERAGVMVSVPPDIRVAMWEKFVFIVAVSGVGAVARAPVGALRSLPETRQLLERAVQEAVAMGRARKIALPEDAAARTMTVIDSLEPSVIPSMQRDIVEGRPSELGSQNGAVVRMGLELGIPTPTHRFIYHSLLPQELHARAL
jgi:2-dehydropantoate 2-reductase